ncbi:hypothetical protein GBAR_LOCUS29768 [Geodia barretti]|uniref:Uncharacterized protein n=1 Tax=Geodia barretti TaxID=519541 RepID=A0AA35TUR1_GEOBA|nr:hypothetical protein GBAR_LOCUS29768 [Geodia barretti]
MTVGRTTSQCGNGDGADEEEQRSGSSSHHKVSLLTLYRRLDRHHPKDPGTGKVFSDAVLSSH